MITSTLTAKPSTVNVICLYIHNIYKSTCCSI